MPLFFQLYESPRFKRPNLRFSSALARPASERGRWIPRHGTCSVHWRTALSICIARHSSSWLRRQAREGSGGSFARSGPLLAPPRLQPTTRGTAAVCRHGGGLRHTLPIGALPRLPDGTTQASPTRRCSACPFKLPQSVARSLADAWPQLGPRPSACRASARCYWPQAHPDSCPRAYGTTSGPSRRRIG